MMYSEDSFKYIVKFIHNESKLKLMYLFYRRFMASLAERSCTNGVSNCISMLKPCCFFIRTILGNNIIWKAHNCKIVGCEDTGGPLIR